MPPYAPTPVAESVKHVNGESFDKMLSELRFSKHPNAPALLGETQELAVRIFNAVSVVRVGKLVDLEAKHEAAIAAEREALADLNQKITARKMAEGKLEILKADARNFAGKMLDLNAEFDSHDPALLTREEKRKAEGIIAAATQKADDAALAESHGLTAYREAVFAVQQATGDHNATVDAARHIAKQIEQLEK